MGTNTNRKEHPMTTDTTYIIKGTNDDATTCACCGRDDLTRVVWLAPIDNDWNEGAAEPYGTNCAARLLQADAPIAYPGGVTRQLANISRAITYIKKWVDKQFDLRAICDEVGVRFNVWATVEDGRIIINTPTGWTEVK